MSKVNYTPEMVEKAVAMYNELGNGGMEKIAEELGRNVRSVRSKLVREGVYIADEKPAKVATVTGPTKAEMLVELQLFVPDLDMDGMMGATKAAIQSLIDIFAEDETESVEAD